MVTALAEERRPLRDVTEPAHHSQRPLYGEDTRTVFSKALREEGAQ